MPRRPFDQSRASGPRDRGRFVKGHPGPALRHGGRSKLARAALLPEQAEAFASLAEEREDIVRDLGGVDTLSRLAGDMVSRYQELKSVGDHLAARLVADTPLTVKGRQRAALTAWLSIVDRQTKLALALGLERRSKSVSTLATIIREHAEAK